MRELSSTHKTESFEEFLNLKALCFAGDAWLHRCSDLRRIRVCALRRRSADLYRDHHAETDQTNKNEPDSASHRHRTTEIKPRLLPSWFNCSQFTPLTPTNSEQAVPLKLDRR
jgi:hypothetical protein